jgi:hypothetical protein
MPDSMLNEAINRSRGITVWRGLPVRIGPQRREFLVDPTEGETAADGQHP